MVPDPSRRPPSHRAVAVRAGIDRPPRRARATTKLLPTQTARFRRRDWQRPRRLRAHHLHPRRQDARRVPPRRGPRGGGHRRDAGHHPEGRRVRRPDRRHRLHGRAAPPLRRARPRPVRRRPGRRGALRAVVDRCRRASAASSPCWPPAAPRPSSTGCGPWPPRSTSAAAGPGSGPSACASPGASPWPWRPRPALLAPVLSQPSLPFGPTVRMEAVHRHLGGRPRRREGPLRGRWPGGARACGSRATRCRRASASSSCATSWATPSSPSSSTTATPTPTPPMRPHSVLTEHLVDEPGQPTRAALDQVLDLFRRKLLRRRPDAPRRYGAARRAANVCCTRQVRPPSSDTSLRHRNGVGVMSENAHRRSPSSKRPTARCRRPRGGPRTGGRPGGPGPSHVDRHAPSASSWKRRLRPCSPGEAPSGVRRGQIHTSATARPPSAHPKCHSPAVTSSPCRRGRCR